MQMAAVQCGKRLLACGGLHDCLQASAELEQAQIDFRRISESDQPQVQTVFQQVQCIFLHSPAQIKMALPP